MATKQTSDEIIDQLLKKIDEKRALIKKSTKPNYRTHLSFTNEGKTVNIATITDVSELVLMGAVLLSKKGMFDATKKEFDLEDRNDVTLKHQNISIEDWVHDIKARIDYLSIKKQTDQLEAYETKLNALITPERQREIQLAKLAKELE